ncbi:MAG: nickel pincer cofactor biosynthesis protein LarC [Gemmatimonadaceae bacterium]
MTIAILDPFSGIAGDMMLGALIDLGLDPTWLRGLPGLLHLQGVGVEIQNVRRGGLSCVKVDFTIPPQPHSRSIGDIKALVSAAGVPPDIAARADRVFMAIAEAEGSIHGIAPERVHLHEVGAVDAILDVVGNVWGLALLGVEAVYCGPLSVGDGFVKAAHGTLPVPAPATLRLLEGHVVRPGPDGAGELVTPTGAGLVRALAAGPPPREYTVRRSGYGAGTKEFRGRANALRVILADATPSSSPTDGGRSSGDDVIDVLSADIDDMSPEYVAAAVDQLRAAGALDVILLPTQMKKGRPGVRVEVLAPLPLGDALEVLLLTATTTLGVRRATVRRRSLPRTEARVEVLGHSIGVKVATEPGGAVRSKPEFDDVRRAADATGRPMSDILRLAATAAERLTP